MTTVKKTRVIGIFCGMLIALTACTGDADIKADLATKATSQMEFAGVMFTVTKGVVTLNGACATEKAKSTVETTTEKIPGIKQVINNIAVAPVVIGTDHQLKQGVDSVLKKYPNVQSLTRDSIVSLSGSVASDKLQPLMQGIAALKPKRIQNGLSVEQSL